MLLCYEIHSLFFSVVGNCITHVLLQQQIVFTISVKHSVQHIQVHQFTDNITLLSVQVIVKYAFQ